MKWEPDITNGIMCRTPFARLSVFRATQIRRTPPTSYAARIHSVDIRSLLASQDGFVSEDKAVAWVERTYIDLLQSHLALLNTVTAMDTSDQPGR